jgi:hypothetical protein
MGIDYKDFVNKFLVATDTRFKETNVCIMVFGPDLNDKRPAGALRNHLINNFKGENLAIKGEHKELIAIHRRKFKSNHDLCRVEYDLAKFVDAIIIIPDSPGSLVELGMFAILEDICRKTLILFCKDHEHPIVPSFISLGPRISYDGRGATVKFVDYSQIDTIMPIVDDFILKIRAQVYDRNLLASGAK